MGQANGRHRRLSGSASSAATIARQLEVQTASSPQTPFKFTDRSQIPNELVQGPFEDFEIAEDVYATAYLIARNGGEMYSLSPWANAEIRPVWGYLTFIIVSQLFTLLTITVLSPVTARTDRATVNCANATSLSSLVEAGFLDSPDMGTCIESGTFLLEADLAGTPTAFYILERSVPFYNAVLQGGGVVVYLLRCICCSWVFSQAYLQEFERVQALLQYHDFSSWFLPLKGESVRNRWSVCIPILQYTVLLAVTMVSFLIICAQDDPTDIVMNSLAFTFITEVSSFFNAALVRQMASQRIEGLDESYGTDPIFYLYPEVKQSNILNADGTYCDTGWYICEDEEKAGLLSDYKVRHNADLYPHDSAWIIKLMDWGLRAGPILGVLLLGWSCGSWPRVILQWLLYILDKAWLGWNWALQHGADL